MRSGPGAARTILLFHTLVLSPLNSLVWYVPSLRYTRGLDWRMHCGAEVTESSTNKQHHLFVTDTCVSCGVRQRVPTLNLILNPKLDLIPKLITVATPPDTRPRPHIHTHSLTHLHSLTHPHTSV